MNIRVVVCENLPDINELYVAKLNSYPDTEVVGSALDLNTGLDVIEQNRPNAVLLDLLYDGWPVERTWDAVRHMKRTYPDMVIVAHSAYEHLLEPALQAGCDSALYRGGNLGIREVHAEVARLVNQPRERPAATFEDLGLANKPSVVEAFMLRVQGLTQQEAAERRNVALSTQKNQEKEFRTALEDYMWLRRDETVKIDSMTKAISVAVRIGLVDTSDFDPS